MGSGIYKITNIINGKFYIGSTINFSRRKAEHFCRFRKNKGNSIIKNALIKYGVENFKFEILEELNFGEWASYNYKIEFITCREEYYLELLNPPYNIRREVDGVIKSPRTEEEKQRLRTMNIGKKNPKISQKLSKPVIVYDLFGNIIAEYPSAKEAGNSLGVDPSNIVRSCNKQKEGIKTKHKKPYNFSYKN